MTTALLLLAGALAAGAAEPSPAQVQACVKGHKPEYAEQFGLDAAAWEGWCAAGFSPGELLAQARKMRECAQIHRPELAEQAGVADAEWISRCSESKEPAEFHPRLTRCLAARAELPPSRRPPEEFWRNQCLMEMSSGDILDLAKVAYGKGPGKDGAPDFSDKGLGLKSLGDPIPEGELKTLGDPIKDAELKTLGIPMKSVELKTLDTPAIDVDEKQAAAIFGENAKLEAAHLPTQAEGDSSGWYPLRAGMIGFEAPPKESLAPRPDLGCFGDFFGTPSAAKLAERLGGCLSAVPGASRLGAPLAKLSGMVDRGGYVRDIGFSNEGLNRHYQTLAYHDARYRERLKRFYSRIEELDLKFPKSGIGSIRLGQEAGRGEFRNLKPGWLWSLAMETADADPKEAVRLIAFCGHDDLQQAELIEPIPYSEFAARAPEKLSAMEKRLQELTTKQEHSEEYQNLKTRADDYRRALEREDPKRAHIRTTPICRMPRSSIFHLPRSLDKEADISPSLRAKLANAQKPDWPGGAPAKNYHVNAAAALACEALGTHPNAAGVGTLLEAAAAHYRGERLARRGEGDWARRAALMNDYREARRKGAADDEETYLRKWLAFERPGKTSSDGLAIDIELSKLDAQYLLHRRATTSELRRRGWSDKRIAAARRRIEADRLDTGWTVAQHRAGFEFAARVCGSPPKKRM